MKANPSAKVWFITGASRGFGRIWAMAALVRGDKVAATARNIDSLASLVERFGDAVMPIRLDVTDRTAVFDAIAQAKEQFGRVDVVLSNAGYGHQGAVEEVSEAEARSQLETNFFGTLWLAQAATALFRDQRCGHFLAVSSVLGVFSIPSFGIYSASKFAVEGLLEALAQETAGFGIKTTLIEPAGYATDFNDSSSARYSEPLAVYQPVREGLAEAFSNYAMGNPQATADAILKVVDSQEPPLRIALGGTAIDELSATQQKRMATWETWREVSVAAQG
ncbi:MULTISPECIES: SDR family NAD(P)-dependent oxidoreductase [Pseudomonas]|uniref:SDR family NAD(P)-dependent oxidoreductase n=1 Tax=Pseudomonas TaxID=286 RepID=UPI00249CE644|nr:MULTISPECIES: SDR family NAD(P)-dependent oxidoreductase [Pseudomonas]